MTPALAIRGLGWTWADGTVALDQVDLEVQPGQKVLITGPSGCGKSTLLRSIAGLLQLHGLGTLTGSITVNGQDPASWSGSERARSVGLVFQEPADQLVTGSAGDEIRFAAVSAGVSLGPDAVREKLCAVGLDVSPGRAPQALSGGQQQRLAVAAASTASLLLLDEPLAHLDPQGSTELLGALQARAAAGTAVVMVEHRLEAPLDWADRVVVLRAGRVVFDGDPAEVELPWLEGVGLEVPPLRRVQAANALRGPASVPDPTVPGVPQLTFDAGPLTRGDRTLMSLPQLSVGAGERVAIVGPNGVGKSTLLDALATTADAVLVPQNPDLSLFCPTVDAELRYGPQERGRAPAITLADVGLDGLSDRSPHGLSRGQRLRLAVAAAVAAGPDVLLLDEPTAGQHRDAVDTTLAVASRHADVLVFATHDVELALRWATRVWVLGADGLVADGPPHEALLHGPLPPLQREQARRGWPITDVTRQLATRESGAPSPSDSPTHAPEHASLVARSEQAQPDPPEPVLGPFAGMVGVLGVGMLAVLLDGPVLLGALALFGVLVLLTRPVERIGRGMRRRLVLGLLAVVWSTMVGQGLFYGDVPRHAVFQLGPVALWWEGLTWGAVQSARFVAVSCVGLALAVTFSPDRLLGALRRLRVPGALAFLAVTALRFVPVVAREWGVVRAARARRGRGLSRRGPVAWVRAEVLMLRPLVMRALRRARVLAETLDSRGFDPAVDRGGSEPLGRLDALVVAGVSTTVLGVAGLQLIYALYLWEIWRHPSLAPLYAGVRTWL